MSEGASARETEAALLPAPHPFLGARRRSGLRSPASASQPGAGRDLQRFPRLYRERCPREQARALKANQQMRSEPWQPAAERRARGPIWQLGIKAGRL